MARPGGGALKRQRRTAVVVATAAAALVLPVAAFAPTFTGSITESDPGHPSTPDIFGDPASTCANETGYPGTFVDPATYNYDAYTIPSAPSCVTVTLTASAGAAVSFAYSGSFNPADLSANYLGDSGTWAENGSVGYSFDTPGQFVVVVEEFEPTTGVGSYTLNVGTGGPTAVVFAAARAVRTPRGVLVRWTIAANAGVAGFDVYRYTGAKRTKLSRRLIPASRAVGAASYRFLDRASVRGSRYALVARTVAGAWRWYGPIPVTTR